MEWGSGQPGGIPACVEVQIASGAIVVVDLDEGPSCELKL